MRRIVVALAGLGLFVDAAIAADMPMLRPAPPVGWNWTGLYWGAHVGGGAGTSTFSDPAGSSLYGGTVRVPTALAGIQLGYNYQPNANWVLGAEADLSALDATGTNTCLASSGVFISSNCRVRQSAYASLTGRAGLVTGAGGRTLLYAKAGGAFVAEKIDINANPLTYATDATDGRFGWTAGAGIEQAMAPAWSVKFEYDYANFGSRTMATPQSYLQTAPLTYVPTPEGSTKVGQDIHTLKVGLNLKFGGDVDARFDDYSLRGAVADRPAIADAEIGTRVWYSFGRFQKDLGATIDQGSQNILVSRLTYQTQAVSGEVFGRLDGPSDLFLKGFAGGGGLRNGKMNDEDWLATYADIPYSNTLSDPVQNTIAYATLDAGYDLFRGSSYRFGGFIGYNFYRDNKQAYGCSQIANQNSDCATPIANTVLGITENDTWHSLRLGVNGEMGLGRGFTLTADAAYLPYVKFYSSDTHWLRSDVTDQVSPERGSGQGYQLEAILAYRFNNAFSIGAGGRYWAMWATTNAYTNAFGSECPCQTLPARAERYGTFLQASYKFDNLR